MSRSSNNKILIIEDEGMLLDIYRRKLYSEGFDVYTAADGNAGLELIRTVHPQLVILDIVMPELEGYTVLKRIKRDAQMRNIPVIIFSNLSQEEEINKALKLGAAMYIVKTSVTPAELVEKVKKFLSRLKQ